MDNVARFTAAQRRELFSEAGARLGMTPAVVEKDFWVSWVLGRLFSTPNLARLLMFKGGTSLSKVYGLIERFSEDIDLILDWRVLGDDDPLAVRSKARQTNLNKSISQQAKDYIGTTLLSELTVALDGICHCRVGEDDAHVIQVRYPAAFSDTYLRPELQLEIGPLAAWLPYENRQISAYASAVFPNLFARREVAVRVISAERTFWEKVTILYQEAHRPEGSPQPARYSRHYYDLARMGCITSENARVG